MFVDREFDSAQNQLAKNGAQGPIQALLLDDSAFDRKRIRRLGNALDIEIEFEDVPSIAAMSRSLDQHSYDLVLIDYQLPEGDGMSALEMVRSHHKNCNAATVMITGNAKTDIAISALRHGFHDFICKDNITADRFRQAVMAAMKKSMIRQYLPENPAPLLDAESLQNSIVAAFNSLPLKEVLQPIIADELRKAIAKAKEEIRQEDGVQVQQLLSQFLAEEEFNFI